jgi:hypothetical protein
MRGGGTVPRLFRHEIFFAFFANPFREFVQKHYKSLKDANPRLPIYIRPCDGVKPHVAARYGTISSKCCLLNLARISFFSPRSSKIIFFWCECLTPFLSYFCGGSSSCNERDTRAQCGKIRQHGMADRGVYSVCETAGMTSDGVVSAVESLEAQAAAINKKYGQGGLGIGALAKS